VSMGVSFGFKCPKCGVRIGVAVGPASDHPDCPECRTAMVPDEGGLRVGANLHCPKCNTTVGLMVPAPDRCPDCGGPWKGI